MMGFWVSYLGLFPVWRLYKAKGMWMLVTLLPFGILCLHWFMLSLRLLIVDCRKLSFYSRAWECIPSDRVVASVQGAVMPLWGRQMALLKGGRAVWETCRTQDLSPAAAAAGLLVSIVVVIRSGVGASVWGPEDARGHLLRGGFWGSML